MPNLIHGVLSLFLMLLQLIAVLTFPLLKFELSLVFFGGNLGHVVCSFGGEINQR